MKQPTIIPVLRYRDAAAAIEWLGRAFGFEARFVVPGPDGTIIHSQLTLANGMVMLGTVRGEDGIPPGMSSVYAFVEDPDAHCARARAAGATITLEPNDTDHGSREYSALDAEGNRWHFGDYQPFDHDHNAEETDA